MALAMPPFPLPIPDSLATDVLVLGAGLAGLRAAWAAKQAAPRARVLLVALRETPSGSSFANANNALGMQYCLDERERRAFAAEAVALAAPGRIEPGLADILANESAARLGDLEELGLAFARLPDGALRRHPGCFSASPPRAAVFSGLARAHALFLAKTTALGVAFLFNQRVLALVADEAARPRRVVGALLAEPATGRPLAVAAGAVVAALGGPAPLFLFNQAGAANPGVSLALLARAGATLANVSYLQFMWAETGSGTFWPVARLAEPGLTVLNDRGLAEPVPEAFGDACLGELAAARVGHCPFGHGLPDSRLDLFLAEHIGADHAVGVGLPEGGGVRVAPMAHAGNGGAAVDESGATSVAGLYAAGECATLMHGANRLGGAMVAATQVFGARAGTAAALAAPAAPGTAALRAAARELAAGMSFDPAERAAGLARLAEGLQRHLVLGGRPGLRAFAGKLDTWLTRARDYELRLAVETALLFARATLSRGRESA
jgi:L-aspartate oxidase